MKFFIDLDNTLCRTVDGDYKTSEPIEERIHYVNDLKKDISNTITIWTARGSRSGVDYEELTKQQLDFWGVHYDELLMKKPDYDIYIDDKSFHVDTYWPVCDKPGDKSKKLPVEIVSKGWGHEIIFVNNDEYCGKLLCFNKGKRFSMHYHVLKKETWYISKGTFEILWIETDTGTKHKEILNVGDVVTNERGEPHQMIALENSEIFEVSTRHYDDDSYRISKGD